MRYTANMKLNTTTKKSSFLSEFFFGEFTQYDLMWKHDMTRFRMGGNRFIFFSEFKEITELKNLVTWPHL